MANRLESIWDALRNSMNPEEENANPIGNSYSQGHGYNYPVPNEWGNSNQTTSEPTSLLSQIPESARQSIDLGRPPIVNNDMLPTKGSMDAMDMMAMSPQNMASGASDAAWNSQAEQRTPVEEPSFMDKAGDFFGDEERMARMTIALNSMRLNPDASLAKSMENKLTRLGKNKEANRSVTWLRENATPQNQYAKYADLIEKNPSMAAELMKQVMGIGKGGFKTSAVQTDPTTGQQYVVKTNPSDGSVIREDVKGALGDTYQRKQEIESEIAVKEQDTKDAYKASQDVFYEAQTMRNNVRELYKMFPLLDAGAETGLLRQYLPAFDANTAQVRSIGNKLGINVINMATFGALSEKELNLALKTAIDTSLPTEELRKVITMKIDAQEKLIKELYTEAEKLSSGTMGRQEYINQASKIALRDQNSLYKSLNKAEQASVSKDVWMGLNLDQREAFIKARGN